MGRRRGGDMVWPGEAAEQAVPHSHVVDKNQEGHLRSEGSHPQTRPHGPGFQRQEDESP